jgi:histidine triad (HIT) family protein
MSAADPPCIFCRIVAGTLPSTQVYADDHVIAIQDLNPQAPVHVLVLPRQHVVGIASEEAEDGALLSHLVSVANRIARERQIADGGYRLVINQGANGGQTVAHLHLHVLGGRRMQWPPG